MDWTVVTSYSLGRLIGPLFDQTIGLNLNSAVNNDHPLSYYGPTSLDNTHRLSVGSTFRIPGRFRLSSIWRVMSLFVASVQIENGCDHYRTGNGVVHVFNIGNYDLPRNILKPTLDGQPGSINGTTAIFRPNRAGYGSSSFALGIPRSWQFALRVSW
jgi:hypothetical protein